jgi:hypothetical protein
MIYSDLINKQYNNVYKHNIILNYIEISLSMNFVLNNLLNYPLTGE